MTDTRTRPSVKRAKITVHSTDLACQVRRAIGWTAVCACGERFPIRHDLELAQADAREHNACARVPR